MCVCVCVCVCVYACVCVCVCACSVLMSHSAMSWAISWSEIGVPKSLHTARRLSAVINPDLHVYTYMNIHVYTYMNVHEYT